MKRMIQLIRQAGRYISISTQMDNRNIILRLLEKNDNAKVIDLGCSIGDFTDEVGQRIGTTEIYGLDINDENIIQSQARGVKVHRADLNEEFPFPAESFDVVIGNQIIEHVFNTDSFVGEIYRVLKREGYAVISTPNLASWHNIACLLFGMQPTSTAVSDEYWGLGSFFNPFRGQKINKPSKAHLRVFTRTSLREFLECHGFTTEKILSVGFYPFPAKIGCYLAKIDPWHAVYVTIKVRKNSSV